MYNRRYKRGAALLLSTLLLWPLGGCDGGGETESASPSATLPTEEERTPATVDPSGAVQITLSGSEASVDGAGATAEGGVVTITRGGTYTVTGTLDDGRIIVNADDADVTLLLSGADITCSYGSPLYIYEAQTATVYLAEGTENTLTDGTAYTFADSLSDAAEEEPNACLYSKDDLVIEGSGALTVNGNYNNGITSKDTLEIYDCALTVNAANHGVNGKDSNTVGSATLTVSCGGDALRSTEDTDADKGWIQVSNATLVLEAGEDGVQAETWCTLADVNCTITSGGGNAASLGADASAKGIKAGTDLTLSGGSYTLDCADDALHTGGDLTVRDGTFTVYSGDDAFHADGTLAISGGDIGVPICYEGLEGTDVLVSGGDIAIVSSDDGINAAGGADGSGFMGRDGMGGSPFSGGGSYSIDVSGGTVKVLAGGDGFDSNGSLSITGGTVVVCSTGNDDGALDSEGTMSLDGGVVFAATGGSMPGYPASAQQCVISLSFGQTLAAGTYVQFASGGAEYVFQLTGQAVSAVFTAPDLVSGDTCAVSYGGSWSGQSSGGVCSGGAYTGGTTLTELTLQSGLNQYGGAGGGMNGGGMFGGGTAPGDRGNRR